MEESDEGPSVSPAGAAGEAKEPPPREEEVEVGAVEGWYLQTSRLHPRVA